MNQLVLSVLWNFLVLVKVTDLSQLKFSMMKIKEDSPNPVGCQIQNLCLLDKI